MNPNMMEVYVREDTTLHQFKSAVEKSKAYGNPDEYTIEYMPGSRGYNWEK